MSLKSPLGRLLPERPDAEEIKRQGWREDKILVVRLDDDRLDFIQREFVKQIGDRLYGRPRIFTSKEKAR